MLTIQTNSMHKCIAFFNYFNDVQYLAKKLDIKIIKEAIVELDISEIPFFLLLHF